MVAEPGSEDRISKAVSARFESAKTVVRVLCAEVKSLWDTAWRSTGPADELTTRMALGWFRGREGSVRMVRATELPWLPVAPKMAIVDLDILEGWWLVRLWNDVVFGFECR